MLEQKLTAERKKLSRRYSALRDEVKEVEQIRKGVYSILREENRKEQPAHKQDLERWKTATHCIAWWDAAREENMRGFAELICIHSLRDNWHKGYGKMMMERVLDDVRRAGYSKLMLWVFDSNVRAIRFYEANGFAASGKKRPALGAVEEMYIKEM